MSQHETSQRRKRDAGIWPTGHKPVLGGVMKISRPPVFGISFIKRVCPGRITLRFHISENHRSQETICHRGPQTA